MSYSDLYPGNIVSVEVRDESVPSAFKGKNIEGVFVDEGDQFVELLVATQDQREDPNGPDPADQSFVLLKVFKSVIASIAVPIDNDTAKMIMERL